MLLLLMVFCVALMGPNFFHFGVVLISPAADRFAVLIGFGWSLLA